MILSPRSRVLWWRCVAVSVILSVGCTLQVRTALAQASDNPPNTSGPHMVIMGTSLTARYDWPALVVAAVNQCLSDQAHAPVELTLIAKAGETSTWGLGQVAALTQAAPDILWLEFTINDADVRRRVSLSEALANHTALIAAARRAHPNVTIGLLSLNTALGPRAWLRPRLRAHMAQYDDMAAADPGVHRIDTGPAWSAALASRDSATLLPDGLHPTVQAAQTINVPPLTDALANMLGLPPC